MVVCQQQHMRTTRGGATTTGASTLPPTIHVRPSSIPCAGFGVFAGQPIPVNTLVTLYPGIYTPPLPAFVAGMDDDNMYHYLADRVTPSGLEPDMNPYILNLTAVGGGYLDGFATTGNTPTVETITATSIEPTSTDSSALPCGHLINHDSSQSNVEVVSFVWNDVLQLESANDDNCWDTNLIPNQRRRDGSPWYYDGRQERVVHFAYPHEASRPTEIACGAAMVSIKNINTDEELLLDYGLHPPYPVWARDWYPG